MSDGSIKISTEVDVKDALASLKRIEDKLGDVEKTSEKSSNIFSKLGSGLATLGKIGAVGLGAVATGTIALGKSALESYANYEQLVGGVETLFKDNADVIKKYSQEAYKTANMSANDYMETVTGFSASLIASLGDDTKKASEYSNRAIIDMSDNANKMGSSMESIVNAYQGFAKQNYTMLDNLKLGYGGTKEEMSRLIADTSEMTDIQEELGVTVDSTDMSFGNIINAISVMQKKLDITGTTAKEASSTISGSINTMKASWENLATALGNKSANLEEAMKTFSDSLLQVGTNIGAVIPTILTGIGSLVDGLAKNILPQIISEVPKLLTQMLPVVVEGLTTLINTIAQVLPQIVPVLLGIIPTIIDALTALLPMLLQTGISLLLTINQGIADTIPTVLPIIIDLIIQMCDTFIANMDKIFDVAVNVIFTLVDGILNALPTLIAEVPRIINSFCEKLWSLFPVIVQKGFELLGMIWEGIKNALPTFIENIPQIIKAIVNVWSLFNWKKIGENAIEWIKNGITNLKDTLPTALKNIGKNALQWLKDTFLGGFSTGSGLISNIWNGISSLAGGVISYVASIGTSLLQTIKNFLTPSSLINVGKNLLNGLWQGISSMAGALYEKVSNFAGGIIDKVKSVFKIFSPSRVMRDEVGKMLVKGIGVGVDVETPNLESDIETNMEDIVATMKGTVEGEMNKYTPVSSIGAVESVNNTNNGITQNITIVNPQRTPSENARAIKQAGRRLVYG